MQELTYQDRDTGVIKQFKEMFAVAPDNIEGTLREKYAEAMAKMTGGQTGLQVALHLTGSHLADFQSNIKTVGSATADGQGHVKDFETAMKGWNNQLASAKAAGAAEALAPPPVPADPAQEGVAA